MKFDPLLSSKPELTLLLECARPTVSAAAAARIRALAADHLDWSRLGALAIDHGVAPLLNLHLTALPPGSVPPDWLRNLGGLCENNAVSSLSFTAELFHALDFLSAAGIHAVPYKGPVLAAQAYGDLSLRAFSDLDLVLRHRDVVRACALLVDRGYRPEVPLGAISAGRIPGQYLFTREGSRVILELHTERTLRYFPHRLNLDELMQHLDHVSVGGREVLTFSAEDLLSFLCVHGAKHFWERLIWIADIAGLIDRPQGFHWLQGMAHARSLGATRMVHLGLLLAQNLLGATLPDSVKSQVDADRGAKVLADKVGARYFTGELGTPGIFERMMFRIRMRGGAVRGTAYLLRLATAPTEEDWGGTRPEGRLAPLQSVLRPLRLFRKYGLRRKRASGFDQDRTPGPR